MSASRFIFASLRHYRRIHVAVALGVAVATVVLTGALVVGDSVRGSLRALTLQRLGRIDSALVSGHLFHAALAKELGDAPGFQRHFTAAEPAILLTGTLQSGSGRQARRATSVSVIGCRPGFWSLGEGGPAQELAIDEAAITEPLARELGVDCGDEILLRLRAQEAIPGDSLLAKKADTSRARRLKIATVLQPEGLARFELVSTQRWPRNLFVPLATLQSMLDKPDEANSILVATTHPNESSGEPGRIVLEKSLRPTLSDYGMRIEKLPQPAGCMQISADRLVLPNEAVRAAENVFGVKFLQPIVTYLANTISVGDGKSLRKIPYSTICGVDSTSELGPLYESGEPLVLAEDEIVLNQWAADDLQVQPGDPVTITYYEPESSHGVLREHEPPPVFKLRAIVPLESADGKPTAAADPKLTPEMPGVTDQKTISDWKLPFELVEKIRPKDEEYWDKYRTTPKAFVSLATAKRLWSSRWGTISLLRLSSAPTDGMSASPAMDAAVKLAREINPTSMGMVFLPIKQQGLAAASGTTPFDVLFLAFSFFLIAAALMLIALLFQLGIEQRSSELGILAAVGIARKRIAALLSREGLIVAAVGATFGVGFGVMYAWLMILGLRTWWLPAIGTPFLTLHVAWKSPAIGWMAGLAVCWLTIRWSIRRYVRQSPARLLSGKSGGDQRSPVRGRRARMAFWTIVRPALSLLTVALVVFGFFLHGESQAGVFFASGTTVLALLLGEIYHRLRRAGRSTKVPTRFSLMELSALNSARNPGRSALSIGLVAAASFVIIAVSAFRLDTSDEGTGGFDYLATSDLPIHYDLTTPQGRMESGFSDAENDTLRDWRIYSFRVADGEDASCMNLYRPTQPRVLGVPAEFINRGGFGWSAAASGMEQNPWAALNNRSDEGSAVKVPVVLDANTAIYSLHLEGVGSTMTIRGAADQLVTLEVVGLLKNSVLQGNLLVSEENFLKMFPDSGGYRFFLIERNPAATTMPLAGESGDRKSPAGDLVQVLENNLSEEGFDVTDARDQLAAFLAVQNTYLSTFQSLGALGLLLGTVGLAVVQMRSVLERRGELALLRAAGFRRSRLVRMVIMENGVLLVGGLAIGCLAAGVALIPQWGPHGVSMPWATVAGLLGAVAVVGLAIGWRATRSAVRAPLLPALRGD